MNYNNDFSIDLGSNVTSSIEVGSITTSTENSHINNILRVKLGV
jgi:hypothetical protein